MIAGHEVVLGDLRVDCHPVLAACRSTAVLSPVFCNDLMKKDRALLHGQTFFNLVDQLGNIDWLGERWTPLDVEASLCLRFRD